MQWFLIPGKCSKPRANVLDPGQSYLTPGQRQLAFKNAPGKALNHFGGLQIAPRPQAMELDPWAKLSDTRAKFLDYWTRHLAFKNTLGKALSHFGGPQAMELDPGQWYYTPGKVI